MRPKVKRGTMGGISGGHSAVVLSFASIPSLATLTWPSLMEMSVFFPVACSRTFSAVVSASFSSCVFF
jgi:hypothetical protein